MASLLSLQEENQLLQQELSRVEDLLVQSRAKCDELAIKYNAVSERDKEHSQDLGSALIGLEEEQQRSASLAQVNAMLREQLDQAGSANQALSEDIRKVTSDWARSRKELEQREAAWRREEE
ncbi:rootletin-like, partial [Piliocolobus tephrosceles]|uniref:rootletin-like n=1 Tax=Piliocolobus tephrosceles TaxID=591936 RepID=UPI000E6B2E3C